MELKGWKTWRLGRTGPVEFIGLAVFGVFMAAFGTFDGGGAYRPVRYLYWIGVMLGGGVIAALVEVLLLKIRPLAARPVLFAVVQAFAMTPPIAVLVWLASSAVFGPWLQQPHYGPLLMSVFTVNAAVVILAVVVRRAFYGRPAPAPGASLADEAAPAPIAAKLPPRLARARLLAVQAEDHYLRIHTEAGDALILMRFRDALAALGDREDGIQTHRSWWVSRRAVDQARWRKGRGELTLENGVVAPVSEANAAAVKRAGWS